MSAPARDEQGVVAVLVSVVAIVMLMVAAMVVDLGLARDTRRQSQNAADAAALAGANKLFPDANVCAAENPWGTKQVPCFADALSEAKAYAEENFPGITATDWATCPVAARPSGFSSLTGQTPCVSFDTTIAAASMPTKVYVSIPTRDVETSFGVLAEVEQIPITTQARAVVDAGQKFGCGLCFLGPVIGGNADFSVGGAGIHVNGSSTDCLAPANTAIDVGPQSSWTATTISTCGTYSGKANMAPAPQNSAHIADPYASLALPPTPWPVGLLSSRTDPCKSAANGGGPGYYASEVSLGNNETCTLEPGLYVISNTWTGKHNSQCVGPGVTLYVRNGGYLDFKNGAAALTPMTTGALAGFSVVYDRTNNNMLSLQGNGTTEISGKV
ncbi:MAG: pilus assembly protein TadG-related protein, partial [Nocardioides sp.]